MKQAARFLALSLCLVFLTSVSGQAEVLFYEDFDDGVADGFEAQMGAWQVFDGVYHGLIKGYNNTGISVAGEDAWWDYHLQLDHWVTGSINQIIRFRVNADGYAYEVNVRADPYNDAHLFKYTPQGRVPLDLVPHFPNSSETWHRWDVTLLGDRITVHFDDQAVFDLVDTIGDPILNGCIGLVSFAGGSIPYQDAAFDNVLVSGETLTGIPITAESAAWGAVKSLY